MLSIQPITGTWYFGHHRVFQLGVYKNLGNAIFSIRLLGYDLVRYHYPYDMTPEQIEFYGG